MTARDTIARALFAIDGERSNPPQVDWDAQYPSVRYRYSEKAEKLLSALTAAGHRIVGPADMEAVEAGWVLVPEEPTDDMLIAAHLEQTQPAIAYANNRARALAVWAAMLASRPKGGA